MKAIYTIAILLVTLLSYGQKASLLQNVNVRAQELKHKLNKTEDSLILNSDKVIEKVEIYNSNFEKKYMVFNHQVKIPITNMPAGRYVTEVKLRGKLILITLLVEENMVPKPYETNPMPFKTNPQPYKKRSRPTKKDPQSFRAVISKAKSNDINDSHNLFGNASDKSSDTKKLNVETKKPKAMVLKEQPKRNIRFYWIVSNINKGTSSSKLMRIGDKEVVDRMIRQNEVDMKSKAGKNNKLTIWEVYDTSKFMRFKRLNPNYAEAKEADCFNIEPIYKSGS